MKSSLTSTTLPKITKKSNNSSAPSKSALHSFISRDNSVVSPIPKKHEALPVLNKLKISEKKNYAVLKKNAQKSVLQVKFVNIEPFNQTMLVNRLEKKKRMKRNVLSSSFYKPK